MDPYEYTAAMEGKWWTVIDGVGQLDEKKTANDSTILHVAAQYGQAEFIEVVLGKMVSSKLPALLTTVNSLGETALHAAARERNSLVIRALVQHATDLDNKTGNAHWIVENILTSVNEDGDTPLHKALRTSVVIPETKGLGFISIRMIAATRALLLLAKRIGIKFPKFPKFSKYPGWRKERVGIIPNTFDDVRTLMFPKFVYAANKTGETPLYLAAECGYHQLVREIAEIPASNYGGPGGRTALHAAVISNNEETTKFLLEWKKDMAKEPDNQGWTPLHYAAELGHAQIAKQLLGVDKSLGYQITCGKEEEDGKDTAVHIAARQGHIAVLKELVSQCSGCWDIVNARGQNMLHVAVESEQPGVIIFFRKRPSLRGLINQKDTDGNTPIHVAARYCRVIEYFSEVDCSILHRSPLELLECSIHGSTEQKKAMKETLMETGVSQVSRNAVSISGKQENISPAALVDKKGKVIAKAHPDGREIPNKKDTARKILDAAMKSEERQRSYMDKVRPTHLLVATLVATCSFAAGMSMPGGYNGKEGPNQGVPLLLKKPAFLFFLISDALALFWSTFAALVCLHTIRTGSSESWSVFKAGTVYIVFSVTYLQVAFITGSYSVLAHFPALAIPICVVTSVFCYLLSSVGMSAYYLLLVHVWPGLKLTLYM